MIIFVYTLAMPESVNSPNIQYTGRGVNVNHAAGIEVYLLFEISTTMSRVDSSKSIRFSEELIKRVSYFSFPYLTICDRDVNLPSLVDSRTPHSLV